MENQLINSAYISQAICLLIYLLNIAYEFYPLCLLSLPSLAELNIPKSYSKHAL